MRSLQTEKSFVYVARKTTLKAFATTDLYILRIVSEILVSFFFNLVMQKIFGLFESKF